MKKILSLVLVLVMALSLVACGGKTDSDDTPVQDNNVVTEEDTDKDTETEDTTKEDTTTEIKADSLDALEEMVNKDVEDTIAALTKDYEDLKIEIDTYDKYKANTETVEAFYADVFAAHQGLTIRLREYALTYAEMILTSDSDADNKYDEMEELYDVIYDGVGEDVYDEIYDGILDDMYDVFYDGILDDAYDTVEYSEWSDLRSDEYDWWSDTRSDVYDDWSDFRSDVYDFWSDMRSDLWDDDIEKATESVEDFKADIEKLKDK